MFTLYSNGRVGWEVGMGAGFRVSQYLHPVTLLHTHHPQGTFRKELENKTDV
uniref:Uncharacterized protein n=1 Tax=Anguilla anguilla TaxID=7936 RepID=A0A0E9SHP4_ANGAN